MNDMSMTLATASQHRADTGGWDVVSCVKMSEMNDAIHATGTSPKEFQHTLDDNFGSVEGTFFPWEIAHGGSGPLINLRIPMSNVTVKRGEISAELDYAVARVQVRLELIPAGRMKAAGPDMAIEKLLVIAGTRSLMKAGFDEPPVTLHEIEGADGLPISLRTSLRVAVKGWLNENVESFTHVFASVSVTHTMSKEAQGEAFAWLKPTDVSFAFGTNHDDPDDSVFAILCQTGGRKIDGLVSQVDAEIIPPGCDAGVCISRGRFLRDMVGQSIPKSFEGLTDKDLTYKDDMRVSINKPVEVEKVTHDNKTYQPVIHELEVTLMDTEMKFKSLCKTKIGAGVWSVCSATAHYTFGLTTKDDGVKTLGFRETVPMETVESTEKSRGAEITGIIAAIAAFIAGAVAYYFSGGLSVLVQGVLATIIFGSAAVIGTTRFIELMRKGDAPPIDLFMTEATSSVTWSTGRTFDPTFAALNNGLQLGGILPKVKKGALGADPERARFQNDFQNRYAAIMAARKDTS